MLKIVSKYSKALVIVIVVFFAFTVIGSLLARRSDVSTPSVISAEKTEPTTSLLGQQTTTELPMPDSAVHKQSFEELGISFWLNEDDGYTTLQQDNTVFVYKKTEKPENGQLIQVFTKNPELTLMEAVRDDVMSTVSPDDCILQPANEKYLSLGQDEHWQIVEMTLPIFAGDTEAILQKKAKKCPADRVSYSASRFFAMDTRKPGKYVFIQENDQRIESGVNGKTWYGTLTFE